MNDQILSSQSMKVGKDKSNSPIRQIYEAPPLNPINCTSSYSNLYPVTYQTMMNYNHRYQDYSPNTKQNTLVEADSLENTIKKQQSRDFYKYQLQQMNAQQNQLYQLNLSPFQSQTITPQKNVSNRQSSQNFQNKIQQAQQNFIKTEDQQDYQQLKYSSPIPQIDKTNRVLFSSSPSQRIQEQNAYDQKDQTQIQQQSSKLYQTKNKNMYDSIHRNVNEIVSKYFKPINKDQKGQTEKLETQSMHQLQNNYKNNTEYITSRNNSQIQDKNWSPLFSPNSRQNNNSNNSIYSQPYELQTIQTQPDSQQYKLFQDRPAQQLDQSYSKYITPETQRILQKWNSNGAESIVKQNNQQNYNRMQEYEIKNQMQFGSLGSSQRQQQSYQQQQFGEFNAQQSFNPSYYQQNINSFNNNTLKKEIANNKFNQENTQSFSNIEPTEESNSQEQNLKNYVLFGKQNQDMSSSQLNQGFIQSNQPTLQSIQQLNTINNISNIDRQTRFDISIQEQNRMLQDANINSLEDFNSFEQEQDQNLQSQNQNNIIYDSNEMFDLKTKSKQNGKKANKNFQESEVFQSLQSTQPDNILTPSMLNLLSQDVKKRKGSLENQQTESHQDLTLKSLLNIPKSLQKISQTNEDKVNFLRMKSYQFYFIKQKKQKTQSLLAFQVVSTILILILLYILLLK